VLVVINELNSPRFSQPDRRLLTAAGLLEFPNFYYDAKPDGFVVPLDALTIINFLNNRALGAEGEGDPIVDAPTATSLLFDPQIPATTSQINLPFPEFRGTSHATRLGANDALVVPAFMRDTPIPADQSAAGDNTTPFTFQRRTSRNEPINQDLLAAVDVIFADGGFPEQLE
jgi:hypothetical protein